MQTIRWYRLFALGALAVPAVARAQGPQPIIKEIAVIPGVAVNAVARMSNGRILILGIADSLVAFDPATKRMTVITRNWDGDLAISPKGDRVAYSSATTTGDDMVWSIPIDPATGAPRGPAQRVSLRAADTPAFAPDGRSLAITIWHGNGSEVAVMSATGGPERILATTDHGVQELSWSADGAAVYAQLPSSRDTTNLIILRLPISGKRADTVMTFPRSAGVAGSLQGSIAFTRPDASALADGRLAYVSSTGTRGEFTVPPGSIPDFSGQSARTTLSTATRLGAIHVLDIATGTTRTITAPSIVPNSIRWSLDGRRFVALLADATLRPHGGVIVMNADGSGQRQYDVPATGGLQLSPTGAMLALGTSSGGKIGLLDLATGRTRNLIGPEMSLMGMRWRSDGKVIFVEARLPVARSAAPHLAILSIGLDGRSEVLRDVSAEYPDAARADPYNDSLATVWGRLKISSSFVVLPMFGGAARLADTPPLNGARVSRPMGSPDGNWVIERVTPGSGTSFLQLYRGTGQLVREIQLPFTVIQGPVLTFPDDAHALVAARTTTDTALRYYVAAFDGSAPRLIASVPRAAMSFFLSPDGKSLIYVPVVPKETRIDAIDFTPVLRAAGIH